MEIIYLSTIMKILVYKIVLPTIAELFATTIKNIIVFNDSKILRYSGIRYSVNEIVQW